MIKLYGGFRIFIGSGFLDHAEAEDRASKKWDDIYVQSCNVGYNIRVSGWSLLF